MPDEAPQRVRAVALNRFAFDRDCEIGGRRIRRQAAPRCGPRPGHAAGVSANAAARRRTRDVSVYPPPAERIEAAQKAIAESRAVTVCGRLRIKDEEHHEIYGSIVSLFGRRF